MKLGKAFSDSIILEKKAITRFGKPKTGRWWLGSGRALIFTTILFVSLFVLAWRLFDLTIIRGHEFRSLAEGNRIKEIILRAPRGRILDRTGKVLADNTPKDGEYDYTRVYPAGQATSPVTGYTGEITAEELADPYYKLRGYRQGDRIGRMGIEAIFEGKLRGRDGRELVEVNASGTVMRTLGKIESVPGEDITISIDRSLTQTALVAFPTDEKGAIVVTRPTTGEVLALITSPSFDANVFSQTLSENPNLPMFNRAIGGTYPPGSTFKIVTAIAGLEEGAISEKTLFEDTGELRIGPFTFSNWYFTQYGKTEGFVDIVKAMQRSNDIFFYKLGEAVGITKLGVLAKRLGVGAQLGIEIPGEAAGLMPNPTWKAKQFDTQADKEARNDEWYVGDTYHVAIGQGYLLTTPLQVNGWTNVIASKGKLCKPTIEKKQQECKELGIKQSTIELVVEGMKRACEPGGTGWPLFNFSVNVSMNQRINDSIIDPLILSDSMTRSIPVACKTGTAEFGDPQDRTHAWFTAFAPIEEPEISVTVLVEGAGEGSDKAAPIAKKILEEWFSR